MRMKWVAVIAAVLLVVFVGCGKNDGTGKQTVIPVLSEKYFVISESDMNAAYSLPVYKNMKDQNVQAVINDEIMSFTERSNIDIRKNIAQQMISGTDVSEHEFSEYGNYKLYCNDGKYLSFYLSIEQRFTKKDKTEFVRQNYVYNYDAVTGEKIDISQLFKNKDEASDYIAQKLYERLLNMDCLESEEYSDEIFKHNVLEYCAIVSSNKVAVVTTAGKFGLKQSAGAPCIEISIPEEYLTKS